MNTQTSDGGPAFPSDNFGQPSQSGMSLRDFFASQETIEDPYDFNWELLEALAGPRPDGDWQSNSLEWFEWSNTWQAKVRYARADAMIEVRNQTKQ